MTLLYMDSFRHQNTGRYTGSPGFASATPRTTGGFYATNIVSTIVKKPFTAASEVVVGVGLRTSGTTRQMLTFWGDGGTTQHITVMVNASQFIEVRRGTSSGTVLGTGTTSLPVNTWFYLEVRLTISDTTGIVQVRLNGSGSNELNLSSQDTKNAGTNSTIDAIGLFGGSGNGTDWAADWYILNNSGSANNTFLGDVVCTGLLPNGNGNSSQLVGSDADSTNNYQLVDEVPASSADYVGSATSNDKDTYAFADLTGSPTVYGVQVGATWAKSDAGSRSGKIVTRSGGSDFVPNTTALSTTYVETLELAETDPATSTAWTAGGVNAAEFGVQVA